MVPLLMDFWYHGSHEEAFPQTRKPTSHLIPALSEERTKGKVGSPSYSPTNGLFLFFLKNTPPIVSPNPETPLLPCGATIKGREPALRLSTPGLPGAMCISDSAKAFPFCTGQSRVQNWNASEPWGYVFLIHIPRQAFRNP